VSVRVDPYDPAWAARGLTLAAEVAAALGPAALRVEHIGSTAVPGLAAKPVYDLQVSVDSLAAAGDFDGPLAGLGLTRQPYERDHVPAGSADPPERWVKRLWSRRGAEPVNLHARLAGSPNERLALLFRDWLRAHPAAVPAYGAFKRVLAAEVTDVGAYSDVKDPVVDLVGAVAEEWAAVTGWSPAARTVSVAIDRPFRTVLDYAGDPRNLPAWSFIDTITETGDGWTAVAGDVASRMVFPEPGDDGVLDHDAYLPGGEVVHIPLRVLPAGAGSVVVITVLPRPTVDLAEDVAAVEKDLAALRAVLEA
jgi:GrpB-like predicted nucleotidyltransferase (UPF0157 family)